MSSSSRTTALAVGVITLTVALLAFAQRDTTPTGNGSTDMERAGGIDAYLSSRFAVESTSTDGALDYEGSISGSEMFNRGPVAPAGLERMPYIIFRILPELALQMDKRPTLGEPSAPFANFGFFFDSRAPRWPVPLGFTWTVPESTNSQVSYVIRTCASCHVGRVRVGDEVRLLEGAANHEMDFHKFIVTWVDFVDRAFAEDARAATKAEILRLIRSKPLEFFFNGQSSFTQRGEARAFSEQMVREQIELVTTNIDVILEEAYAANRFLKRINAGLAAQFKRAGDPEKRQPADVGPAGIADSNTNGIQSIVIAHNDRFAGDLDKQLPQEQLFPGATKVALPSVWQQERRTAAQWTASVTVNFFRNTIAAMGFGAESPTLNGLHLDVISRYTEGLPPPRYPFTIDRQRADLGKAVYEQAGCPSCHVADQRTLTGRYPDVFRMGTSTNRSLSGQPPTLGPVVVAALYQVCSANSSNQTLKVSFNGEPMRQPCSTDPREITIPRPADDTGYPATPLDGIWVRAPYLHNGSVPTLYHLLAHENGESLRPQQFARGSIEYDQDMLGWQWRPTPELGIYDTTLDGFANRGHEGLSRTGIWIDGSGKPFKLSWNIADSREREALDNLLEYLKAL